MSLQHEWDWDLNDFGDYDPNTLTFEVELGSDAFATYMDTEFPDWLEDNVTAANGSRQWQEDIIRAARMKYGNYIKVEFY